MNALLVDGFLRGVVSQSCIANGMCNAYTAKHKSWSEMELRCRHESVADPDHADHYKTKQKMLSHVNEVGGTQESSVSLQD